MLGCVLHAATAGAQSLLVKEERFRSSSGGSVSLQAVSVGTDVTWMLPQGGRLLNTGTAWVVGGQSLLGVGGQCGTGDASAVAIETAAADRIAIDGTTGTVGFGTAPVSTTVAVAGGLTVLPPAMLDIDTEPTPTVPVNGVSFVVVGNSVGGAITPTTNVGLSSGSANGQILIIRGGGPEALQFAHTANINLSGGVASVRAVGEGDIIMFVWSGTQWLEMRYANN